MFSDNIGPLGLPIYTNNKVIFIKFKPIKVRAFIKVPGRKQALTRHRAQKPVPFVIGHRETLFTLVELPSNALGAARFI